MSSTTSKRRIITGVLMTLTLLIGMGIGTLLVDPRNSDEYKAQSATLSNAESDLGAAKSDLSATRADLDTTRNNLEDARTEVITVQGDLPEREQTLKDGKAALAKKRATLTSDRNIVAKREKAVAKREKAVGIVERVIANNTLTDGIYEVGNDIRAGTYKTKGAGSCYYAVLGSADTNNIITNNFGSGPSVVSVSRGQYLELSCDDAKWRLQT